ncbi:Two component regulator propeller domain protein [Croceitalea dokdonensis DOKDO 023]|uniref:Two component regulator propeller domain protein n=1 Tax=Croceitalea dokdonensis DOKDO 023 TaxID=1300341 RepID=A0A0P7AWU3_9FLAO|nr:two-component regulator propeller domain-containing protein [Croceitalea dokdonensis]KPM30805.1 Two component regulator propeller domain protein [Croceitalea dokdonensis DOKDO 023]
MRETFSIILILLFFKISLGQEMTHFTKENSELTDDKIWGIAVDDDGNKWIGTGESGLIKFDGTNWTTYDKSNSEVKGSFISPIFVDSNNNVWVSYSKPNGLVKFDGQTWKSFSSYETKLSDNSVIAITEDENGILYFGGTSGLTSFDGENWKKIYLPKKLTIRAIAVKNSELIYIGHNNGLLIFKDNDWESLNDENSELQNYVRSLKFDVNGDLIIGYGGNKTGGLSILSNDKWTHMNKENSELSDNLVRDIEIDNFGLLWLATNNGLNIVTNDNIIPFYFRERGNAILDIAIEDKVYWIATHFGLFKILR